MSAGWKLFGDLGVPILLIAGLAYATRDRSGDQGRARNPFVYVEPAYGGTMKGCGCGCKGAPGGCGGGTMAGRGRPRRALRRPNPFHRAGR